MILTIVVDDDILERARIRAIEENTSVNAVVRTYLATYAGVDRRRDDACERFAGALARVPLAARWCRLEPRRFARALSSTCWTRTSRSTCSTRPSMNALFRERTCKPHDRKQLQRQHEEYWGKVVGRRVSATPERSDTVKSPESRPA